MFEQEFALLCQSIVVAGQMDSAQISSRFEVWAALLGRTTLPDQYTKDAIEGARVSVGKLATALSNERLPRFTVARLRYAAREAILAAQDEWRRQIDSRQLSGK